MIPERRARIDQDLAVLSEWYPNAEGYTAQLQGILVWEADSRLPNITVSTLVIHGENDPLVPAANGRLIAERIPGRSARHASARGSHFHDRSARGCPSCDPRIPFLSTRKTFCHLKIADSPLVAFHFSKGPIGFHEGSQVAVTTRSNRAPYVWNCRLYPFFAETEWKRGLERSGSAIGSTFR